MRPVHSAPVARGAASSPWRALLLSLVWASGAGVAAAKDHGIHTPSGRDIYAPDERFGQVLEQDTREFVIEVVTGIAAEGNLGVNLGWLAPDLGGLELYAGGGVQTNPSLQWMLAARYWFDFFGLRPFLGMGYANQLLPDHGTGNASLVWELGYKWRVHHTYHFTLGVGVRYLVDVWVEDDSPLRGPDVDPLALQRELDDLGKWVPTLALRFSRAF